jgi:hypothetical protein
MDIFTWISFTLIFVFIGLWIYARDHRTQPQVSTGYVDLCRLSAEVREIAKANNLATHAYIQDTGRQGNSYQQMRLTSLRLVAARRRAAAKLVQLSKNRTLSENYFRAEMCAYVRGLDLALAEVRQEQFEYFADCFRHLNAAKKIIGV